MITLLLLTVQFMLAETNCIRAKIDISYKTQIKQYMIEGKELEEFIGRIAKRFIKKGECLTNSNTKKNYLIKSGQKVKAYISLNGIKISFDAVALTDADKGEQIKIFNKKTAKVIIGYVKENSEIEIKNMEEI